MANVSSLGVGTGIDLNSLLTKLMSAESAPITQLNTKQASYNSQLSAFGRIQSAVDKLATAAGKINTEANFKGFSASVVDTDYASATATSFASAGSFSLRVNQLAQANKLLSGANPAVAAGTLQIELGDISGGSFVAKAGTSPVTVNFTGSTIEELRSAINSANAGVSASIINGAGGNKQLMLTSNETGATNTIRLTGGAGLAGLTYDPITPSAAFTEKSAAQDAKAEIEGVLVTSSTNTLTEAMTGVSITVKKAHDPLVLTDATTLNIGTDTDGMATKIEDFVTAWNELNTLTKDLTKYDAANNKAAILSADGTISTVNSQLRSILFSSPVGASTEYPNLSSLGLSLQPDGSLALDKSKFSTAVAANMTSVTATVTAFGAAFKTSLDAMTDTDGTISNRQSALNTIIKNLDTRRDELQRRVDAVEKRYRAQFTALDKLMGQMQTQSTYLAQQLANLG